MSFAIALIDSLDDEALSDAVARQESAVVGVGAGHLLKELAGNRIDKPSANLTMVNNPLDNWQLPRFLAH